MNIVRFPCFAYSDPRSGISLQALARKLKRVVRLDAIHQMAYLESPSTAHWYASKAPVVPLRRSA